MLHIRRSRGRIRRPDRMADRRLLKIGIRCLSLKHRDNPGAVRPLDLELLPLRHALKRSRGGLLRGGRGGCSPPSSVACATANGATSRRLAITPTSSRFISYPFSGKRPGRLVSQLLDALLEDLCHRTRGRLVQGGPGVEAAWEKAELAIAHAPVRYGGVGDQPPTGHRYPPSAPHPGPPAGPETATRRTPLEGQ